MATIDRYRIEVDTARANNALSGLRSTILGIGTALASAFTVRELVTVAARFQDLRTSLRAVYRDVELGNQAFEQIKDFATTTVFSVEQLTESVIKLKAAGLDPTVEQLELFADVSSVAADSVGALQAITDLYARTTAGGLGIEELERLGDRGIPVFRILAERANIARDEVSEIGKTAEGAQALLRVLEGGLQDAFGGASADRANNVNQAIINLRDSLDNMFDTIGQSGFNDALANIINGITDFIQGNQELIESIGRGLANALTFAAENARIFAAIIAGAFSYATAATIVTMAAAVFRFADGLRKAAAAGAVLQGVTGVGLAKVAAGLAAAAAAVVTVDELIGETSEGVGDLQDQLDELKNQGPLTGSGETDTTSLDEAVATLQRLKDETGGLTKQSQEYFNTYKEGNQSFIDSLRIARENISLSQEQIEYNDTIRRFNEDYRDQVRTLQDELQKLNEKPEENARLIEQVNAALAQTHALYQEQLPTVESIADSIRQSRIEAEARAEAERAAAEAQRDLERATESASGFIRDLQRGTEDLQNDLRQLNMNPLERQIDDIETGIQRKLQDRVRELQALKTDTNAGAIEAEIQRITRAASGAIEQQARLARESYRQSRSFAEGWRRAFEEYADNATNAGKRAEEIFRKTTQGLEDLLFDFVKTGRFNWKTFVQDITDTLLRSQLQQLIARTFAPDGLLGGVADMFGLGDLFGGGSGGGGQQRGQSPGTPLYVADVTGGGGSAVNAVLGGQQPATTGGGLSGIANGISNSIGNVFSGVTSSIGSAVSSIFGGFFANGGFLPAGKVGVVGERGPEMIGGPAQVTPMASSVTYNINAVDAASFKQLVARDPQFIHAVASQGGRAVPARR